MYSVRAAHASRMMEKVKKETVRTERVPTKVEFTTPVDQCLSELVWCNFVVW